MNKQEINKWREKINRDLLTIYTSGPSLLVHPIQYILKGKGKRLRPILSLLTAEACGGSFKSAIPVALAVEILHNFTLVHDDIMDEDNIRHGMPTVHSKWDDGTAILTGDAMLSLALKTLQDVPMNNHKILTVFTDGLLAVCEGQAYDKEFESQDHVSVDDYLNMIDLKTGHLIGMAAELGALSVCDDDILCKAVRDYGRKLGRAFQIQDDILELYASESEMGKSLDSDVLLGKKTYPILKARELNETKIQKAFDVVSEDVKKGKKIIRDVLEMEGIKQDTLMKVREMIDDANAQLTNIGIHSEQLLSFSEMIAKRNN